MKIECESTADTEKRLTKKGLTNEGNWSIFANLQIYRAHLRIEYMKSESQSKKNIQSTVTRVLLISFF
jgi:hypothetical protein